MKTLKLESVVGHQMDDVDGSQLGILLSTTEGEVMLLAAPATMKDAAEKMYLAAETASRLADREEEVQTSVATLVSATPARSSHGQADTIVVSVSLGTGIPVSFYLSARDVDLISAALAKASPPPPKRAH